MVSRENPEGFEALTSILKGRTRWPIRPNRSRSTVKFATRILLNVSAAVKGAHEPRPRGVMSSLAAILLASATAQLRSAFSPVRSTAKGLLKPPCIGGSTTF